MRSEHDGRRSAYMCSLPVLNAVARVRTIQLFDL
jgi:hypothetical protein